MTAWPTVYGPLTSSQPAPPVSKVVPTWVWPKEPSTPAPVTTAVGSEFAVAEPAVFVAVTATRSVWPTSADASVYAAVVAPAIAVQAPPPLSQRCQA